MLNSQKSTLYNEMGLQKFLRKRITPYQWFHLHDFNLWLCVLLVVIFSFGNFGCRTRGARVKQQQKAIEKRKEEKRKQQQEIYEKTLEHHQSMQGNDGKRRLEEANKHRKKLDKHQGKSSSWFKRLFTSEKGGCSPAK